MPLTLSYRKINVEINKTGLIDSKSWSRNIGYCIGKDNKFDYSSSSSNQKIEAEGEREKKLQEIDEQIVLVLPVIQSE